MRWMVLMVVLGCGPKQPLEPIEPGTSPILPSPEGRLYATGEAGPRDPIVAAVVEQAGLPWQESLAGAATYLALHQPFTPELALARWGAVRAGYPHPIRTLTFGIVGQDTFPTALASELARIIQPGDELGLIRARSGSSDRWVALIGRPQIALMSLPREHDPGDWLELPGEGQWRLQSPEGEVTEGALPSRMLLQATGEWWLELRRRPGGAPAISIPLYVGMATPPAPVLELPGAQSSAPAQAVEATYAAIDEIRAAFSVAPLAVDETLEVLARYPLEQGLAGARDPERGIARLRGAGFVGGPAGQVYCEGRTVVLCLDSLMWNIDSRQQLLSPGLRLMGAAAEVRTDKVAVLLNVTSE
ncbi:MAG: hypothetical protein ACI8S6_005488 [Myxococcota bacterium]|jgi:hypothetical protein